MLKRELFFFNVENFSCFVDNYDYNFSEESLTFVLRIVAEHL
jgi:hypothetical protein